MVDKIAVEQLIRPEIRAMASYAVPSADNMIKLDAMENPYQWNESDKHAWLEELSQVSLNRYPDPAAAPLQQQLRRVMGIDDSLDVMLGNGSDELIQMLMLAVAKPGATVLSPEPGFSMYKMIASWVGLNYIGVPLGTDFSLDGQGMLSTIKEHQPALIFLALPNNPTGNLFDVNVLQQIIEASSGLVILDEAYTAFASRDHLDWASKYNNVLVMRTLSKVGLAGLRLGLLVGAPAWIEQFNKVRMPYNINVLTQASATFALTRYNTLLEQADSIKQERQRFLVSLKALDNLTVFPSEANFILFRLENNAQDVFAGLKEKGILIKCLDGSHPLLKGCLRVTVGLPEENTQFLAVLKDLLA